MSVPIEVDMLLICQKPMVFDLSTYIHSKWAGRTPMWITQGERGLNKGTIGISLTPSTCEKVRSHSQ